MAGVEVVGERPHPGGRVVDEVLCLVDEERQRVVALRERAEHRVEHVGRVGLGGERGEIDHAGTAQAPSQRGDQTVCIYLGVGPHRHHRCATAREELGGERRLAPPARCAEQHDASTRGRTEQPFPLHPRGGGAADRRGRPGHGAAREPCMRPDDRVPTEHRLVPPAELPPSTVAIVVPPVACVDG